MSDRLRGDGRKSSRRQWLKTTGGLTLAAAGSQLGCAATGDDRDEAPIDLRNPEKQAGTLDPLRAVIDGDLTLGGDPRLLVEHRAVFDGLGDVFAVVREP